MGVSQSVSWSFLLRRAEQFEVEAAVLCGMIHRAEDRWYRAVLLKRAKTYRLLCQEQRFHHSGADVPSAK